MKTVLKFGVKIIAAEIVSLAILSLSSLAYSYSGIHIKNPSGATDYAWMPNQWKANMTEGFSWMRMDENGFNNLSILEDIDILLMGSSQMEATNVPQDANTAALLNEILTDIDIYNIGTSGHTIYNCVSNMEDAVDAYSPSKYIVLETDRVKLETSEMQKVIAGEYPQIKSYDSGIIYWIQKYVPAIKNIYKGIESWIAADCNSIGETLEAKAAVTEEPAYADFRDDGYTDVLNAFLAKAAVSSKQSGANLVIFYQPSTEIDEDGRFVTDWDGSYTDLFRTACEDNGILFIDMTEEFRKLYEEEHILAHGFINTAVGKGHLNRYGHEAIAERLAEEFMPE